MTVLGRSSRLVASLLFSLTGAACGTITFGEAEGLDAGVVLEAGQPDAGPADVGFAPDAEPPDGGPLACVPDDPPAVAAWPFPSTGTAYQELFWNPLKGAIVQPGCARGICHGSKTGADQNLPYVPFAADINDPASVDRALAELWDTLSRDTEGQPALLAAHLDPADPNWTYDANEKRAIEGLVAAMQSCRFRPLHRARDGGVECWTEGTPEPDAGAAPPPDAGETDAGAGVDGGPPADAGPQPDGGPIPDTGYAPDAGQGPPDTGGGGGTVERCSCELPAIDPRCTNS